MKLKHFLATTVLAIAAYGVPVLGQQTETLTTAESDGNTTDVQSDQLLSPEELQTLVAPVALYPDTLLIQILVGATAPLDVIKADRILTDNQGADEEAIKSLIEAEQYDESVEVLAIAFPTVLQQMAVHIDWTETVGDAMLAQSDDVLDAVQVKRNEAVESGALTDTPQQVVTTEVDTQAIVIQPANPEVVYVPQYDPQVVYSDTSNNVGDAVAGSLIAFGTVALISEIFDDDDDWGHYWGCRNCGGWGGRPIYRNPDVDIDVGGNVNIGNKFKPDLNGRPDHGWHPDQSHADMARDRIANHRKPDGTTKLPLDRPPSRSDELRNKLGKGGIGGTPTAALPGRVPGQLPGRPQGQLPGRPGGQTPNLPNINRPDLGGSHSGAAGALAKRSPTPKAIKQPKVPSKPAFKPSARPKAVKAPVGHAPKIARSAPGPRTKASSARGAASRGGGKLRR